jgi:lysozyme family protein
MAQLSDMIPFLLYVEAYGAKSCKVYKTVNGKKVYAGYDPSKASLEQQFCECEDFLVKNNKLKVSGDKGGLTMCGVTFSTYATYCNKVGKTAKESGLKTLSYNDWYTILHTMFWNRWKADQITNQAIANILVDWYWISGINGVKRPQRILGVKDDGIVGPKTVAAVNAADPQVLFDKLKADRFAHFKEIVAKTPSQQQFYNGWVNRVNMIHFDCFKYT